MWSATLAGKDPRQIGGYLRCSLPPSITRTAGGRPGTGPALWAWAAIAVRTRMLVRVISRFDDTPSAVIARSSCTPASGGVLGTHVAD